MNAGVHMQRYMPDDARGDAVFGLSGSDLASR